MTSTEERTEASRALMVRMYDSAVRGDFPDVLACLSPDLVVNEPPFLPYGEIYRGRDGFEKLISRVTLVLDVSRMVIDRMVAEDDRVIGIIRMPELASGEDILLAEESLIRDGQVVEINVYFHETRGLHTAPRL
jgi:ketosteroid isomerase-like protein